MTSSFFFYQPLLHSVIQDYEDCLAFGLGHRLIFKIYKQNKYKKEPSGNWLCFGPHVKSWRGTELFSISGPGGRKEYKEIQAAPN
jgi:hypothetical protein